MAVIVEQGASPFELSVATEVFGLDRPELAWQYSVTVCGRDHLVRSAGGLMGIVPAAGLEAVEAADMVIVPGHPRVGHPANSEVVDAVCAAADAGARLVSFCSGAFVLAQAGLLDGRPATTHWMYASRLAEAHPAVVVRPDVLFVDDDPVFTAAGSAAALDLSLHLVGLDHGAAGRLAVARRLVFAAHRPGDQRQFFGPDLSSTAPATVPDFERAVGERLDGDLSVPRLAALASMSVSHFHRWFKAETGLTPNRWVTGLRVERARLLLETTDLTVERIANETGLGTGANLRLRFKNLVGTSPSDYRRLHQDRIRDSSDLTSSAGRRH